MGETSEKLKIRDCFVDGPIAPEMIAKSIAAHQTKTNIGAHDLFLGQVRKDLHADGIVQAIEYTSYREMANIEFAEIREEAFSKFDIVCLHIHHSLGMVKTGEICLSVFVSAAHRKSAFEAIEFLVEEIKKRVPIFGKEIFENSGHQWKQNKLND